MTARTRRLGECVYASSEGWIVMVEKRVVAGIVWLWW